MSFPPFQAHAPFLLSPSSSFSGAEQQPPPLTTRDLFGATWHMIASSSTMWQDRKSSITVTYSATADGADGRDFYDVAAWSADNSSKQHSTKGLSCPAAAYSGYVYAWRGTGWLRLITTRWEVVGLGVVSHRSEADGADGADVEDDDRGDGAVVLVTFVQKTTFSPPALSVFIRQEHLNGTQEENVVKRVVAELKSQGMESLHAEVDKLRPVPWN
ncbi:hypothetical protein GGS23DRAFT_470595 [Durotheca rogersii]|uniref:uncharacterized protein n=1 Tax=Durotheca rogersii TaxID=419775 RepID=UPI002220DB0B|nr:uncharacterized protein GGS23DRAFT_470595 [Durotheca rogersii]KAI5855029.1 hypothetical protein GGS23DRAFT_470595 [Durotheca rogersii]